MESGNPDDIVMSVQEILDRYKSLWEIEAAFRVNKHDLKMRPIYHWTEPRIRAHVSICFLSYTLIKHALHRLNVVKGMKISFEKLRDILLHAQSSILIDITTNKRYVLPSNVTSEQITVYQAFGLKRSGTPYKLLKNKN